MVIHMYWGVDGVSGCCMCRWGVATGVGVRGGGGIRGLIGDVSNGFTRIIVTGIVQGHSYGCG